jgi:hypothetical protein
MLTLRTFPGSIVAMKETSGAGSVRDYTNKHRLQEFDS